MSIKLSSLLLLLLTSCSYCKEQDGVIRTVNPPEIDAGTTVVSDASSTVNPPTQTPVISHDNWTFTLPDTNYTVVENQGTYTFKDNVYTIFFDKETFKGTTPQFALIGIRVLKEKGRNVANDLMVAHINNRDFMVITSTLNDNISWAWSLANSGNAYLMVCGGDRNQVQYTDCNNIAQTLVIK